MSFEKKIGNRIVVTDFPGYGENSRVHVTIREGWSETCRWNANKLSLEEVSDLYYALGRLLAHAQS